MRRRIKREERSGSRSAANSTVQQVENNKPSVIQDNRSENTITTGQSFTDSVVQNVAQLGRSRRTTRKRSAFKINKHRFGLGLRGGGLGVLHSKLDRGLGSYTKTSRMTVLRSYLNKGMKRGQSFATYDDFANYIVTNYGGVLVARRIPGSSGGKWSRPSFSSLVYRMATASHFARVAKPIQIAAAKNLAYSGVRSLIDLSANDLAVPHRYPWGAMKGILEEEDGKKSKPKSVSLNISLSSMTTDKCAETVNIFKQQGLGHWESGYKSDQSSLGGELIESLVNLQFSTGTIPTKDAFQIKKAFNNAPGNVPDLGPHTKVNIPVSDRLHLNAPLVDPKKRKRRLSVSSMHVSKMDPSVLNASRGVAYTSFGDKVVGTDGTRWDPEELSDDREKTVIKSKPARTNLT